MNSIFHFKSFLNFLGRNKLFTEINVFGFAVSLMFVILLGLYVQDELSVDSFQANKDRIFRVEYKSSAGNMSAAVPPGLAGVFETQYPEIEATTRLLHGSATVEPVAGFTTESVFASALYVDSAFFNIFSFPFVEGSPAEAMRAQNDIVLTQRFARRMFGGQPAMGKNLCIAGHDFTVSGVVSDFEHTHLMNPEVVMPMRMVPLMWLGITDPAMSAQFMGVLNGNYDFPTYLMGRKNTDLAARLDTAELSHMFGDVLQLQLFRTGDISSPQLRPLEEIYLNQCESRSTTVSNSRTYLLVLRLAVLAILLFAVINYINLSVAQSGFRAQEAAMRQLLGGSRRQLFANYIMESLVICLVSFGLALLFAKMAEPWFRNVMQTRVSLSMGLTPANILLAMGGVLVIGVVSGLVPAYVLTRFKPIDVVRGTFKRQTKMVYSKVLIAFQYCITIALIGCSVTIVRQLDFMRHSDLGFDTQQVITCSNLFSAQQMDGIRGELMSVPGVSVVSSGQGVPGMGNYSGRYSHYDLDGKMHDLAAFYGDTAFLRVFGIKALRETGLREPDGAQIWLTETAWRELGLAPDATEYTRGEKERFKFKIAGVLQDFHTDDFTEPIYPALVRTISGYAGGSVFIRISGGDAFATMDRIREIYNRQAGGNYFDGRFLQQDIDDMYRAQERMAQMIGVFSLLAILISALGMLAMSTYFMRQRAQEVAVRKVFGATDREVLTRLVMSFLRLVVIAFVVAVPVIWYLMSGWLSGYAYRISLSWTIFAVAGGVAFAIAFVTVLWQSLKATRANPILSIKD